MHHEFSIVYNFLSIGWNVIPEPGTFALLGFGLFGMFGLRRRNKA
jgi:hypothetical protein